MTARFKYVENFLLFLLFSLLFSTTCFAADNDIYNVENIPVNVTAKSPSASRTVATATAHRDAFLVLLTRLGMATSVADTVTDEEISDMVRSEYMDNERLAGNNYAATFNITFAKDFVDHILGQKNTKKDEVKSEETQQSFLVIPVKVVQRKALLWEESNDWKKMMERYLAQKNETHFISPKADMENISTLSIDDLSKADYSSLEPMIARYKANAAYLLFFSLDDVAKKVTVEISYIRRMQKKQMKLNFVNLEGMTSETMLLKVSQKVIDYLKKVQSNEVAGVSSIQISIQIPITTLGNYLMIKNKIESSNLVNSLNIESLSRDNAFINVGYVNSGAEITEAFAKIGLTLQKKSDDFYLLNPNQ